MGRGGEATAEHQVGTLQACLGSLRQKVVLLLMNVGLYGGRARLLTIATILGTVDGEIGYVEMKIAAT